MEQTKKAPNTLEHVQSSMNQTWTRLSSILQHLAPVLDSGPDAGGWTPRQVLSHIVGALQRIPIQSAFFLTGQAGRVPILINDPYWLPEWEHAPLESFTLAIQAAFDGQRAFINSLSPDDLACTAKTVFGEMTLGEFLTLCYNHVGHLHAIQLEGFQS